MNVASELLAGHCEIDEAASAKLPAGAWQAAVRQDGRVHPHAHVAELTAWINAPQPGACAC